MLLIFVHHFKFSSLFPTFSTDVSTTPAANGSTTVIPGYGNNDTNTISGYTATTVMMTATKTENVTDISSKFLLVALKTRFSVRVMQICKELCIYV